MNVNSSDGRIRVRHREYIADTTVTVAFACTQYQINPGLVQLFPWLSSIARNYESYKFHDLRFFTETSAPTSSGGTVMLAVDYDAADAAPTSKLQLMSYHGAIRSPPWAESVFRCDKQDLTKFGVQRYIRSISLSSNLDIKTYDVGTLNYASQGSTSGSTYTAGELYVEYDIELMTPVYEVSLNAGQIVTGVAGVAGSTAFGPSPTSTGQGYFTVVNSIATCVIAGSYLITYQQSLSSGTWTGANPTGTATIDLSPGGSVSTSTTGTACIIHVVGVTATVGQTLIVQESSGGTWSSSNMFIMPCSSSLF